MSRDGTHLIVSTLNMYYKAGGEQRSGKDREGRAKWSETWEENEWGQIEKDLSSVYMRGMKSGCSSALLVVKVISQMKHNCKWDGPLIRNDSIFTEKSFFF